MTRPITVHGAAAGSHRPRLLYIGSLPCEPFYGGPIQLHRHFVESGDYDFHSIVDPQEGDIPFLMTGCAPIDGAIGRVSNTRFHPNLLALNFLVGERRIASRALNAARSHRADAIVTVAFGPGALAAGEIADRLGLPLITFFHDWWPDLVPCRGIGKRLLDRRFRHLYRKSTLALCVSPEMREELGDHPNAPVLHPIPAFAPPPAEAVEPQDTARPFRLVYLGTLEGRYGKMAQALARRWLDQPNNSIELALFGPATDWPADLLRAATERGLYGGKRFGQEAAKVLREADGFLVLMNFEAEDARRVRTSFPSKVLEYCPYGKPLIGWTPSYSSLPRFFRSSNAGLAIDNPSATKALEAIAALAADSARRGALGLAARRLAATTFNPHAIHAQLRDHIARVLPPKMSRGRILIVSNFFPPVTYGGFEIACGQVAFGLRALGFTVNVLTSSHRASECPAGEVGISRVLASSFGCDYAPLGWVRRFRALLELERQNQRLLCEAVASFRPDIVYFWNLGYTSRSLLALAARRGWRHGCFTFDYSLLDATADAWGLHVESRESGVVSNTARALAGIFARMLGRAGGSAAPDFVHYPTDHLCRHYRDRAFPCEKWVKTAWGVDEQFFCPPARPSAGRLLYVGQVLEHKGVHLAIAALGRLRESGRFPDLELTVAGQCLSAEYRERLDGVARQWNLTQAVSYRGVVRREELPALYSSHGILVFPSVWDEPMGIVVMEAMACGLAVVCSGAGGSGELIRDGVDGLLFTRNDAGDCARKIGQLLDDSAVLARIQRAARQSALERFRFSKTVEVIAEGFDRAIGYRIS